MREEDIVEGYSCIVRDGEEVKAEQEQGKPGTTTVT